MRTSACSSTSFHKFFAKRLVSLIIVLKFVIFHLTGQPAWFGGTPSVIPHVLSEDLSYGINQPGKIYVIVINYAFPIPPTPEPTSLEIKTASASPFGNRISVWRITIPAGNENKTFTINAINQVGGNIPLIPNKDYTFYFVAEDALGNLQATPTKIIKRTLTCPTPIITQSQYLDGECSGAATAWWELTRFDPPGPAGPNSDIDGIFKGTTWEIRWDYPNATPVTTYTSASDGDVPGAAFYSHTYSGVSNCVYTAVLTVTNPCGLTLGPMNWTVDVHGRDVPSDGDGKLLIGVATPYNVSPVQVIKVCEGRQHLIQLIDNSTWNCQDPHDYLGNARPKNDKPRTIQWVYGENDAGAVLNTIASPVLISGIHSATSADGYVGAPVIDITSTGQLSEVITIPAACVKDQYFDVYLRNWNKCNSYPGNSPVYTYVRILVVDAPDAPTVSDVNVCNTGTQKITVSGPVTGILKWYDSAKNLIYTGAAGNNEFTPSPARPIPSSTQYYVSEVQAGGDLCEGPMAPVTLNVYNVISNNTIAAAQTICSGAVPATLTGSDPAGGNGVYTYLWQVSTAGAGGPFSDAPGTNNAKNYTSTALTQTTWFRRTVTSGGCSGSSPVIAISVNPLPTLTGATTSAVCPGSFATINLAGLLANSTSTISYKINGVVQTPVSGVVANASGAASFSITALTYANNGQTLQISGILVTSATPNCTAVFTRNVTLAVNPAPTLTGASQAATVCAGNTATINLAGMLPGSTSTISYTIDGTAQTPVTGIISTAGGAASFSTAALAYSDNGKTLQITGITVTSATPNCSAAFSRNVTLSVNANPTLTGATQAAVCAGDAATINLTGLLGGTTSTISYKINGIAQSDATGIVATVGGAASFNTRALTSADNGKTLQITGITVTSATPNCSRTFTQNVTLSVNPVPTLTGATQTAVCSGNAAIIKLTGLLANSTSTVSYTINGVVQTPVTGVVANATGTGSFSTPVLTSANNGQILQITGITVTSATPSCSGTFARNVTISINPLPTLTGASQSSVVCSGNAATINLTGLLGNSTSTISYTINGVAQTPVTGVIATAGGAASFSSRTLTSADKGKILQITGVTVASATPNCSGVFARNVTLNVNPNPTLTGATQSTVCSGSGATINLTGLVANSTSNIDYKINGVAQPSAVGVLANATGAGSFTSTVLTSANNGQILQITGITITSATPNCSGIFTQNITLVVNPVPTLSGATQATVCSGSGATINLTGLVANSTSTIDYKINGVVQPSVAGAVANAAGVASFTSSVLTLANNGQILQITGITITSKTPNCTGSFAQNITLIVNPNPTLTGATQATVCSGSGATISLTGLVGSSTSTIDYKIYGVDQPSVTGVVANAAGTASFTSSILTSANDGQVLQITGITITSKTPGCTGVFAQNVTLDVEPTLIAGVIGSDQSKCNPADPDLLTEVTAASGGLAPLQYQWKSSTTPGGPYANIGGATATTYNPPAGLATTTYYIRQVTTAAGGACGSALSNEVAVIVNPGKVLTKTVVSSPFSKCKGSTLTLTTSAVANATSYVWDFSWLPATVDATTPSNTIVIDLSTAGAGASVLAPGSYNIKAAGINGCNIPSDYPWSVLGSDLTINDIPDLSFLDKTLCSDDASAITLGITNLDASYCSGLTYNITAINQNGLTASAGSPAIGTGLAANEIFNDAYTNTTNANVNVIYKVVPVSTQGCNGLSEDVTLTIKSEPKGWNATTNTCSDVALSYNLQTSVINVLPGNSQASNFSWVAAANASVTGESTTTQSGNTINDVLNNITGSDQIVVYTVTPTGTNGCTGNSFTVSVTVKSEPLGWNATAGACSDVAVGYNLQTSVINMPSGNSQPSAFSWIATDNLSVTGESTTAKTGNTITDVINNVTGTDQTVTYTVSPTGSNGCAGNSFTVQVTVKSEPKGVAGTASTCSDVALGYDLQVMSINAAGGNGQASTFSWVAANNTNVSGESTSAQSGGTINDNINNLSGVDQTVIYTVTPTGTNGCAGNSFQVTATIKSEPKGWNATTNTCSDVALAYNLQTSVINTASGNNQASTFSWVAADNASVTGESTTAQSGNTINDVLNNITGSDQTVVYTVTPTGTNGCAGNSFTVTVTVKSEPLGWNATASACSDVAVGYNLQTSVINVLPGNSQSSSFSWVAAANPNVTGESTTAQSGNTINDVINNVTGVDQTVTYTVTPTGSNGCAGNSFTVDVTVKSEPKGVAGTTSTCSDVALSYDLQTLGINASGGNNQSSTFSWIAASNSNVSGESSSAQSGGSINDNITNVSGIDQTVIYTVTPTGINGCTGNSFQVTATIKSEPKGWNATTNTCSDVALAYNLQTSVINSAGGNSQASTFSWVAADNASVTGESTTAQSGNTINDVLNNITGSDQIVVYTVTPTGTNGCTGNSFTVSVTVKSEPLGWNATAGACSDVAVGYNLQTSVVNMPSGNSQPSAFSWIATDNPNVTGESTTAKTGNTIADVINNVTGTDQTVTYTVTPTGSNGCAGNSFTVQVTVKSEPKGVAGTASTCSDVALGYDLQMTSINAAGGNGQASTFSWVAANNTNVSGESTSAQSGGTINDNINNLSGVDQTVIYTVTPTGTNGCAGNSFQVTATIKSEPKGWNATTNTCSDVALAYNLQTSVINTASGNNQASTFSWVAADNASVTGESTTAQSGNTINDVLNNISGSDQTVVYTVTPTGTNGCTGNSFTVTVTVKSEPVGTNVTETICSGNLLTYNLQGNINLTNAIPSRFTYTVVSSNPAGVPAEANRTVPSNSPISHTYVNATGTLVTITYTITPVSSSGACEGNPFTYIVKIGAQPILDPALNRFACSNEATGLILKEAAGSVVPTDFDILSVAYPVTLTYAGSNIYPSSTTLANYLSSDKYINTTTGNLNVTYKVQPRVGTDCIGDPVNVIVTIRPPIAGGLITGGGAVCYNTDAPAISNDVPASGGDGSISYKWYYTEVMSAMPGDVNWIEIPGKTAATYDPDKLINPTKFIRKANDGSCTATAYSNMVTFTINPLPVTTAITGDIKLCDDATNKIYMVDNHTNSTYQWSIPGTLVTKTFPTGPSPGIYLIMVDAINNASGSGTIQVIETNSSTGCVGTPVTKNITVSPVLDGEDILGPPEVCIGEAAVPFTIKNRDGSEGSTYSWIFPAGASVTGSSSSYEINLTFGLVIPGSYVQAIETTAGGCTTVHKIHPVLINPLPVEYALTGPSSYCDGEAGVTLTLSDSQTGVNYQLYDGITPIATELKAGTDGPLNWTVSAGSYTVKATNSTSLCEKDMNGTVVVIANPAIVINPPVVTDVLCKGGATGTITITASGGTPSYLYSVQSGPVPGFVSSNVFTGLIAGTYNIVVKDSKGCKAATTIAVDEPDALAISSIVETQQVSCFGGNDGEAEITVNPLTGTGPYTYQWYYNAALSSPVTGQTSGTLSGVPAGTYYVLITDANLCILSSGVTITQPSSLTATVMAATPYHGKSISCKGESDGSATATGGGGTAPYSYEWFTDAALTISTGKTTATATGLSAGTYWVKVTDDNGCWKSASVSLTEPPLLTATTAVTSDHHGRNVSCFGATDGEAVVTPVGGTAPYTYEWFTDALLTASTGKTGQTATGLSATTYWVKVTDDNGCETSASVILNAPAGITVSAAVSSNYNGRNISCVGSTDGRATATPSGGTAPYTYEWFTDAAMTITTGKTAQIATGLSASTYWVKVTDVNGCEGFSSVTLTAPPSLAISVAVTSNYNGAEISCSGGSDGKIKASPVGGTGSFSYTWYSNAAMTIPIGQTTQEATGLGAGTYYVKTGDANGCTISGSATLVNPLALIVTATAATPYHGRNISCIGESDGSATAAAMGGTGSYHYEWFTDATLTASTGQTTVTATGLSAGIYWVKVTDDNNCFASASVTLADPPGLTATAAVTSNYHGRNISCFGAADGKATATPAGGTAPYSYEWFSDTGMTTPTGDILAGADGLSAGNYWVKVRDANNCETTATVTLIEPAELTAAAAVTSNYNGRNIRCNGAADGKAKATPAGGTGAYTYIWYSDAALSAPIGQTSAEATGLAAGTYWVKVTDANLCTVTTDITLTQPTALTVTASATSNYNGMNISCFGASNGTAMASVSGGTAPFNYEWYSDATLTIPLGQTTQSAIALSANTYWVKVTDANNCETSASVVINGPLQLAISAPVTTQVLCYGQSTGAVNVSVSGGVMPAGGYYFSWTGTDYTGVSFSGSTEDITNIKAGIYNLIVKDVNNCTANLSGVTVGQTTAITVVKDGQENVDCYGDAKGKISITASGGTGPYIYAWTGHDYTGLAFGKTADDLTDLKAGTYNLTVTDINTCTGVLATVVITQPDELKVVTAGKNDVNCYDKATGSVFVNVAGGTPGYTYSWTGTDYLGVAYSNTTQDISGLKAGTYTLTVTDSKSCTAILAGIIIAQPVDLTPGSITGADILCFGENPDPVTEATAPTGGPLAPVFQWQSSNTSGGPWLNIPGAQLKDYTPPASPSTTMYYRRAVTSGTCVPVYSNVIEIKVNPLPVAKLTGGGTICSGESSILRVELTTGASPFEITINGTIVETGYLSNSPITVSPVVSTTYRITKVKDNNGCEVLDPHTGITGTARIDVRALPVITGNPSGSTICEYGATSFTAAATGDDISWKWQVKNGSVFEDLSDGGVYLGTTTSTLKITGGTRILNGKIYRAVATGCGHSENTAEASLTVNISPVIETQPVESTVCTGGTASFSVTASGTALTYQWQVNKGGVFEDIPGANLANLTLSGVAASWNNYLFKVIVSGECPSPVSSNFVLLKVNTPPLVTVNPLPKSICAESGTIFITANGTGIIDSMRWQVNNSGTWTNIHNSEVYSGTNTQQLSFINPPASLNGKEYRLSLRAKCATVYSDPATITVHNNPVVTFVPDPITNCGGTELVLSPLISGGSGTWSTHTWTGDAGPLNRYEVQRPIFKTNTPGSYNLIYKVKDSNGCFGSAPVRVNVDSPDAAFTQDRFSDCADATVSFTKDMTGISSWKWDFGDGTPVNTTTPSPTHVFTNPTPSTILYRTVSLTVRSAGGCQSTKTSVVTVYPAIDATFTANKTIICSGEQVTFTGMSGANTYSWNYGDGVSGSGTNVAKHSYTITTEIPQVFTIRLSTSSFYGCNDEKTLNITVMPVPVPQFSGSPTPQIYNATGNTVNFTNETNSGTWTYSWSFGDTGTSALKSPSHTYTTLGTFNVALEVSNGTCTEKVTHQVIITPLPPEADFEPVPSGCEPLIISIHNTSRNVDAPGTSYKWDFGDGSTSTAKNPVYTFTDPGIYLVELTISGPGGTSVKSQVVNAYPTPRASFDVAPAVVFVNDEKVRGFNLSTGADYYVWEWGDGDTSKLREPYHKYMEPGIYDISLSAYKDNGNGNVCFDKYTLSPGVTVEPAGEIRFSTVFRPNLDGPIEMDHLPTGGSEIDQFFFPPVREKIINYKLQIFNRLGVLVYTSHDINIPWNGYYRGQICPQGVYVWYVEGKYSNGQPYKKVGDLTLLH